MHAASYPASVESDWVVHDYRFHSGETLPELKLHYTTIGSPSGEPVLILHGTGGAASGFLNNRFAGSFFGPGQPLDAAHHFIILPHALGAGKSSKPSDGLRTRFPHYTYDDMVTAQYRLVKEHLGIAHLRLVAGRSAGAECRAWLWGETYPVFLDALLPMASQPSAMAGRNWMMRRMLIRFDS